MAAPELPDFDELALRLVQLRRRENDLSRRLHLEQERHTTFGSAYAAKAIETLRAELEPIQAEIASLEEQLRPVLRRPEEE